MRLYNIAALEVFQSTPPSREATCFGQRGPLRRWFQSTPPSREATRRVAGLIQRPTKFQSTPPSREATATAPRLGDGVFVSIHAPLTGGDVFWPARPAPAVVSIHAPLTGGDKTRSGGNQSAKGFNPRPPHGRGLAVSVSAVTLACFNPRPPSREATASAARWLRRVKFQSTPPSREATITHCASCCRKQFQSTPPSREATIV